MFVTINGCFTAAITGNTGSEQFVSVLDILLDAAVCVPVSVTLGGQTVEFADSMAAYEAITEAARIQGTRVQPLIG